MKNINTIFSNFVGDNDEVLDHGGCPPNYQETHTLVFAMGGSGSYSSWELRYDEKLEVGDYLI